MFVRYEATSSNSSKKRSALSELPQVFSSRKATDEKTLVEERERMFQQIGQLQYELAWLKKKVGVDR